MRRIPRRKDVAIAALGAVAIVLSLAPPIGAQDTAPPVPDDAAAGDVIPNHYIVTLETTKASKVPEKADQLEEEYDAKVDDVYKHAIKGFSAEMSADEAAAMSDDPAVKDVEPDRVVSIVGSQSGPPWGLDRVDQTNLPANNLYNYATTGSGVTAYIIDTGIRASHQDFTGRASVSPDFVLASNNGVDCNGHGTHVAGTIGGNTKGVAKGVSLVAVRVLGCNGSGAMSGVIAGVNWVTANAIKPAVANMSLGTSTVSQSLNNAVANSVASGVTYAVAAGNDNKDACAASPASTPAALTIGATDNADNRATFSNWGTCVDLFAPGVSVLSDWHTDNTATNTLSGTSMATPHVAGTAALFLAENPGATPSQVEGALEGSATVGKVVNPGTGSPNLLDYTSFVTAPAATVPGAPALSATFNGQAALSWTVPFDGRSPITGYKVFRAQNPNGQGSTPLTTLASYVTSYTDAAAQPGTPYYYKVAAVNAIGQTLSDEEFGTLAEPPPAPYTSAPKGNWVGAYGSQGYLLGGWNNGSPPSDLGVLPNATFTLLQGGLRHCWACPAANTDDRALQSPATPTTLRRAATWYHGTQLQLRLNFTAAYDGPLRLYAVDWDSTTRRQRITVNDGSGNDVVDITTAFNQGAWVNFPIDVNANGVVNITVDRTAGANAVISGIFLGNSGPPATTTTSTTTTSTTTTSTTTTSTTTTTTTTAPPAAPPSAPQGNWVGVYGSQGYMLGGWNNGSSPPDLGVLPNATFALGSGGLRYCWACSNVDSNQRALQSPTPPSTQRRAATWYHATQLRLTLTFSAAYNGPLRLYAIDWDSTTRRQRVTVSSTGSTNQVVNITTPFNQGAWLTFPINVTSGTVVNITVDRTAGANAVISGIFLGNAT